MSSSSLDCLELCRLCLVKDRVSVPIFEDEGDVRQIFLKITACLPVKVSREDKLPKKICDDCVYKVELFYQFWNTTANAEKQLLQWLDDVGGLEDKQGYITNVLDSNVMKQERTSDSRLDGSVMQVSGHQNNMDMGMMENMTIMTMPAGSEQQFTSVPMDTSGTVQTVQAVPGPSSQTSHEMAQSQSHLVEEEEEELEDDNSDDGCDNEEGLPVKEEAEDQGDQSLEQTTFVNVPLSCDEAGPSGLQQQKISEISEMSMQQTADGEQKTGYYVTKLSILSPQSAQDNEQVQQQAFADDFELAAQNLDEDDKSNVEGIVVVPPETTILQCTLCGEAFVDEASLDFHLKSHDEQSAEQVELISEETANTVMLYACDCCGQTFEDEAVFQKHQQTHQQSNGAPEKLYSCDLCSYTSAHRQNLASHQRRHNLEYKYQCEICGAGFYARNNYQEHLTVHSREKPFQCEICQATFRYRQGLRLHAKLHQPDYVPPQKKHCCEVCNKRFCRKQVLLVHMRTHGNVVPQNEYVCHICSKAVSSKTYLTVHVRKHTGEKPHVCDLCGKGFISQNYLSVHRRTHTGERPHKCTHCEKSFTQRTTLVVHLRSHTGDRPYPCTYCHKSFASKTMLNSHLKTHAKQSARAQQEQQTQLHLQQQNLLLSPEEEAALQEQQAEQQIQQQVTVVESDSNIVLIPT